MYLEEMLPDFRKGAKIRSVLWRRGQYLRYDAKTKDIIDEEGITYDITGNLLSSNLWEFYQEPIDWDYIIKNKCPCWFWNKEESKRIGILTKIEEDTSLPFIKDIGRFNNIVGYKHCRPVSRDEIIFYEDII